MKQKRLSSIGLVFLGIMIGGLIAFNFNPNLIMGIIAKDKIGADAPPVKISPMAKQLNEAFISVSQAVLPTVVSINVKSSGNRSKTKTLGTLLSAMISEISLGHSHSAVSRTAVQLKAAAAE